MRISDWSSDVCSSDLSEPVEQPAFAIGVAQRRWCSLVQYGKIIPHQHLARQRLVALAILRLMDTAFDLQDQFDRLRSALSFDPVSRGRRAIDSRPAGKGVPQPPWRGDGAKN